MFTMKNTSFDIQHFATTNHTNNNQQHLLIQKYSVAENNKKKYKQLYLEVLAISQSSVCI